MNSSNVHFLRNDAKFVTSADTTGHESADSLLGMLNSLMARLNWKHSTENPRTIQKMHVIQVTSGSISMHTCQLREISFGSPTNSLDGIALEAPFFGSMRSLAVARVFTVLP